MLEILSKLEGSYSAQKRAKDAEAAWQQCNIYLERAYLNAPGDIDTPNALQEKWTVNIRRCLYYIAATAVPPKLHGLPTKKTIRVHPTVVQMLTNSSQLLRVDPVDDERPSSFSCNIILGAPVVQKKYYRKLIPFYFRLDQGTVLNHFMTQRNSDLHTAVPITNDGWLVNYSTAMTYVKGVLATGASNGVIVRFINQTHMVAVLLFGYHAYIFDHNTTNNISARRTMATWGHSLHAFLTAYSPEGGGSARTHIPNRLHGIAIQSFGHMIIGNHIWNIGVAFNIGPQPGNGDCQRGTSNIISRLLTTQRNVAPEDYYVSKKIQLVWSWVLLDAIANAYPELYPDTVWDYYKRLIALYERTRQIHVPSRVYLPTQSRAGNLLAMLDLKHTYNVWRWDDASLTWQKVTYFEYNHAPYQYSLYIYDKSEIIYYRLLPHKNHTFILGERGVANYSAAVASAAGSTQHRDGSSGMRTTTHAAESVPAPSASSHHPMSLPRLLF